MGSVSLDRAKRWFYVVLLVFAGTAGGLDAVLQPEPFARVVGTVSPVVCTALAIAFVRLKDIRPAEWLAFFTYVAFMLVKLSELLVTTGMGMSTELASFTPWLGVMYVVAFLIFEPKLALRLSIGVYLASLFFGGYAMWAGARSAFSLAVYTAMYQLYLANGAMIGFLAVLTSFRKYLADVTREAAHLKSMAHTDYLLGLPNRRRLSEILASELELGALSGRPVSLILLDVDRFKAINDTQGHAAGDAVLQAMATLLAHHVRTADTVGRWGGEEFLVVAPETGLVEAGELAERLCALIRSQPFPPASHVTASFGVATLQPGESLESLVARADAALYRAKANGRERVEVAS